RRLPFEHLRQTLPTVHAALINRRKRRRAPAPFIDHRFEECAVGGQVAVDAPLPTRMPTLVELLLMAMLQETLPFAVADLLSPISPDRIAMMVPDQSARAEGQSPPALLQPPGDVHVVARLGVARI